MKKLGLLFMIAMVVFLNIGKGHAQLPNKVVFGMISINDGSFKPDEKKYSVLTDSLEKILKTRPNDTTCLFYRALLYLSFNSLLAKPYQGERGVLENLITAKSLTEKAVSLNMTNFNLKILRAQIYKEMTYRFTGDESWKYNSKQINIRKAQFNNFKELANKYYDELAKLDSNNAYDYQKLKVTEKYPL
jgi:hypothetical protein